jgi:hypothetical protein
LLANLLQWHHRLPWARRLTAAELTGVGLVRLAFSDDAAARPLYRPLSLVPGVSAARLRRFVARHGYDERPGPAHWPLRELGPDPVQTDAAVRWRYLLTAAYPAGRGEAVLRVLAGRAHGGKAMAFAGRRALSARRTGLALAAAALLVVLGAGTWWAWQGRLHHPAPAEHAILPTPVASAPASSPPSHAVPATTPAMPGSAPALGGETAASAATLEPEQKLDAVSTPEPAPPASATIVLPPPRYALVSLPQADPEAQSARAMQRHISQTLSLRGRDRRLEWMPSPDGQVLTLWPFTDKQEAERLALKLQRQGLEMQVVAF